MSETDQARLEALSKPCVICGKPIPISARKCTECDSYQHGLARFLGGLNLSALITLIPIATLAWAFVYDRLELGKSEVSATAIECQRDEMSIFVINRGDRPALVRAASIETKGPGAQPGPKPLEFAGQDLLERVVEPARHRVFRLRRPRISNVSVPLVPPTVDRRDCVLLIALEVVDFDQEVGTRAVGCACPVG